MAKAGSWSSLCNRKCWALACLLFFGLFIFSGTDGNLPNWGDDIFFISHVYSAKGNYLKVISKRGFLTRYYSWVYDLMGQNLWNTHLFNFGLFAVSVLLCYASACRFLKRPAALCVALYYLAFISKYDLITCNSAGAYLLALIIFFLSVWLAFESCLGPWSRGLLIALINWLTAHLCEILLVATPLYPFLFCVYRWRQRLKILTRELFPTFLPLVFFLLHIFLISIGTPKNDAPMWVRSSDMKLDAISIPRMVGNAFWKGIKGTLGIDHYRLLEHGLMGFFHHYDPKTGWVIATFCLFAVALAVYLWQARDDRKPVFSNGNQQKAVYWTAFTGALYLILFTPIIGFPIIANSDGEMPSRFLVYSGVGVALLIGLVIDLTSDITWARRTALGMVLALILLESFGLHSIIHEYQTSATYDRNIRQQIQQLALKPRLGDTFFLSLPRHPSMNAYWKEAPSQYECRSAQSLLILDYNLVKMESDIRYHNRLHYFNQVREKENDLLNLPLDATSLQEYQTLYPLYLRGSDQKLFALRQIQVIDDSDHVLRTLDFYQTLTLPPEQTMVGRASAVFIDYPVVDTDRKVVLNFFDPACVLKIKGRRWDGESSCQAQLWQEDKLVTSKTLDRAGDFLWEIPLGGLIQPDRQLVLRNASVNPGHRPANWTVESISLQMKQK